MTAVAAVTIVDALKLGNMSSISYDPIGKYYETPLVTRTVKGKTRTGIHFAVSRSLTRSTAYQRLEANAAAYANRIHEKGDDLIDIHAIQALLERHAEFRNRRSILLKELQYIIAEKKAAKTTSRAKRAAAAMTSGIKLCTERNTHAAFERYATGDMVPKLPVFYPSDLEACKAAYASILDRARTGAMPSQLSIRCKPESGC